MSDESDTATGLTVADGQAGQAGQAGEQVPDPSRCRHYGRHEPLFLMDATVGSMSATDP